MADTYFSKLPTIEYNGSVIRDLSRVVAMPEKIDSDPSLFHLYQMPSAMRPDVVADAYYDDSHLDWLILLANGIVDPYYGWYLSDEDFNQHLISKYGSIENAQRKVAYWRNNWKADQDTISVAYYNNNIPAAWRRYYTPVFGYGTSVIGYQRRTVDWVVETNKIVRLTLATSEGIAIGNTVSNGSGASGEAAYVSPDGLTVDVKNVVGQFSEGDDITGAVVTAVNVVQTSLDDDEVVFWTPVTYYQLEHEANEANRSIHLLDTGSALSVSNYVREVVKQ